MQQVIIYVAFEYDYFKMRAKRNMALDVKKETHHVTETCCGGLMVPNTTYVYTDTMTVLSTAESIQYSTGQEERAPFPMEAYNWKGQFGTFRQ